MRAALYARVSTLKHGQNPETQLLQLRRYTEQRGWEVAEEFVDKGLSGAKDRRPALDRLMASVRRQEVDVVLVARFDRFARSMRHLTSALEEFQERGVEFVSASENIDTSTSWGRALFGIIAALAALELDILRERVQAGLRRARAEGKQIGRPKKFVDVSRARALLASGASKTAVAETLGISRRTLSRAIAQSDETGQMGAEICPSDPAGESALSLLPSSGLGRADAPASAHSVEDPDA